MPRLDSSSTSNPKDRRKNSAVHVMKFLWLTKNSGHELHRCERIAAFGISRSALLRVKSSRYQRTRFAIFLDAGDIYKEAEWFNGNQTDAKRDVSQFAGAENAVRKIS